MMMLLLQLCEMNRRLFMGGKERKGGFEEGKAAGILFFFSSCIFYLVPFFDISHLEGEENDER